VKGGLLVTTVKVGVQDAKGEKISNSSVVIKDKFTGITVGSGVTGGQGEADISWTGFPGGSYRVTATTPKGAVGIADFELDWIAASRAVVVNVPTSQEGNWWATFYANYGAAWNQYGWIVSLGAILGDGYIVVTRGPAAVEWTVGKVTGERRPEPLRRGDR